MFEDLVLGVFKDPARVPFRGRQLWPLKHQPEHNGHTVEPCLTDTPQQRITMI